MGRKKFKQEVTERTERNNKKKRIRNVARAAQINTTYQNTFPIISSSLRESPRPSPEALGVPPFGVLKPQIVDEVLLDAVG